MTTGDHWERRVLDPTIRAEVRHYDGAYIVTTGDPSEHFIGPMPHTLAVNSAAIHNGMHGHEALADRRGVTS